MGNYLVVGGSKGIGAAIVSSLLAEGHHVYNFSRSAPRDSEAKLTHSAVDILEDELDKDMIPDSLDGVVYCPGSITLKPIRSLVPSQFIEDFNINVIGAVKTIKATIPALKRSGANPSILLFSTVAVQQGLTFHSSIAAAKGGVEGLVRALAAELAPSIRVNAIAPSLTDTDLAQSLLSSPEKKEASNNRHPLRRYGAPEDIAHAAMYLLDNKASWVTGQILHVDGGLSVVR